MSLKPTGPRGAFVPAASRYDGRSRDWVKDATGHRVSISPVDSGVQFAMANQIGDLLSSPDVGNDLLSKVDDIGGPRQHEQVVAAVKRANPIARYLKEGSITILSIEDDFRVSTGTLLVTLNYRNNVTGTDKSAAFNGIYG